MADARSSTPLTAGSDMSSLGLACSGGPADLLLVQGARASWYPLVYENYHDATKYARALRKREQKLLYVRVMADHLRLKTVVGGRRPARVPRCIVALCQRRSLIPYAWRSACVAEAGPMHRARRGTATR